jgi:hypothetical protein
VPAAGFFLDTGEPEGILQTVIFPGDMIEKRLQTRLANRNAIGRVVLASSTELMKAADVPVHRNYVDISARSFTVEAVKSGGVWTYGIIFG